MRRAVSLTRVSSLCERPPRPNADNDNAEYVVNRAAILASLLLLALLVGTPAVVFALWPSLFVGRPEAAESGPLLVTVQEDVNPAPPSPADRGMLEAIRQKQAWEAQRKTTDPKDATRRSLRKRRRVARKHAPMEKSSEQNSQPTRQDAIDSVDVSADASGEAAEAAPSWSAVGGLPLNRPPREALLCQLVFDVPELRLDDKGEVAAKIMQAARKNSKAKSSDEIPDSSFLQKLVAARDDLAGLPFRWDGECKIEGERLKALCEVSSTVRSLSTPARLRSSSKMSESEMRARDRRLQAIIEKVRYPRVWRTPEHVPAMEQMLQTEDESVSLALVDALSEIPGREASRGLARRALFDLEPRVRTYAVAALRNRKPADYQQLLTSGLRYPWAPAAVNAAEALVQLEAKEAVPELIEALELPPPGSPHRNEQGRWVVRELVKVNHFRNCALCHAPVTSGSPVSLSAAAPVPGRRLPQRYYRASGSADFVRPDITYLRQDFSLMQQVEDAFPWPDVQRFDFLVRTRVLTHEEQVQLDRRPQPATHSPQRDAIVYTLRQLTGKDGGDDPQRWRQLVGLAP